MRILCFGDSNTYGFDPRGYFGDRYGAEDRWVDLLAKQTGYAVINAGINGREIPHGSYTSPSLHERIPADILLVMLGTNDLLQGGSPEEIFDRMEYFLRQQLPRFRQIILVAPPPMKRGTWVPTDTLVTQSFLLAEEYKLLAEKLNILFMDTRQWNIELAFDGVHFTEAGHHSFAKHLIDVIPQAN